jgi:hypothetical protein
MQQTQTNEVAPKSDAEHKNEATLMRRLMEDEQLREQIVDQARKNMAADETNESLLAHILRVIAAIRRFLFGDPGDPSAKNDAQDVIQKNRDNLENLVKSDSASPGEEIFVGQLISHGKVERDGEATYSVSLLDADGKAIELLGQELEEVFFDAGIQLGENIFMACTPAENGSIIWTVSAMRPTVVPDADDGSDDEDGEASRMR